MRFLLVDDERLVRGGIAMVLARAFPDADIAEAGSTPALTGLLANAVAEGSGAAHDSLSARELEVLRLVAGGRTQKEIAADLSLSEKTVATHRQRPGQKLGVHSGVELTRYALRHDLVD